MRSRRWQAGRRAATNHPERVLEVRYEELTTEPAQQLERIFSFLEEATSEAAVDLISTRRINSSYGNRERGDIRKAKDPKAAPKRPWNQWTSKQRRVFLDEAGDAMKELGYATED